MLFSGRTLQIEVERHEVRIDNGGRQLRILRPDGRKQQRQGLDGARIETRCRWKDGSLVVESKSERGMKMTESYTLARGGRALAVKIHIEGRFGEPITLRSHYDAAVAGAEPGEGLDVEGPPAPSS
jgi:hypothetical protein